MQTICGNTTSTRRARPDSSPLRFVTEPPSSPPSHPHPRPSLPPSPSLPVLLTVATVLGYTFTRTRFSRHVPTISLSIILGLATGGVLRLTSSPISATLRFDPETFFFAFLPPIIWNAGFSMQKKSFFTYFSPIVVFGILGTLLSTATFGLGTYLLVRLGVVARTAVGASPLMESLMFGAAVSATDSVSVLAIFNAVRAPDLLRSLVFGESVLNDAAVLILFQTFRNGYSAARDGSSGQVALVLVRELLVTTVVSLLIGLAISLGTARGLVLLGGARRRAGAKEAEVLDIAVVVLSAYLAFLTAVAAQQSGIIALLVSGVVHSHCTWLEFGFG